MRRSIDPPWWWKPWLGPYFWAVEWRERPKPVRVHWCGETAGRVHHPVIRIYRGRWTVGPCGRYTALTWHGRQRVWVCWHYEQCTECGHVLRYELAAEDCPGFIGAGNREPA